MVKSNDVVFAKNVLGKMCAPNWSTLVYLFVLYIENILYETILKINFLKQSCILLRVSTHLTAVHVQCFIIFVK